MEHRNRDGSSSSLHPTGMLSIPEWDVTEPGTQSLHLLPDSQKRWLSWPGTLSEATSESEAIFQISTSAMPTVSGKAGAVPPDPL